MNLLVDEKVVLSATGAANNRLQPDELGRAPVGWQDGASS